MTTRQLIASDLRRLEREHGRPGRRLRWLGHPSAIACALVRLRTAGGRLSSGLAYWHLIALFGIDVGRTAVIGEALLLPHPTGLVIGSGVRVGARVTLYQRTTLGKDRRDDFPTIADGATILPGAVVYGGVRIGAKATIGANVVVGIDVPDGVAVRGGAPTMSPQPSAPWKP